MSRPFVVAVLAAATLLASGCQMIAPPGGGQAAAPAAGPSLATQSTILGLQTWLMLQQSKASEAATRLASSNPAQAEKQRARAASAGTIMTSLGALRTESNCSRRLQLANAVSGGLQSEFPTYQAELSLGTNLAGILASGFPGCQ